MRKAELFKIDQLIEFLKKFNFISLGEHVCSLNLGEDLIIIINDFNVLKIEWVNL